jgi:hypothetical protein
VGQQAKENNRENETIQRNRKEKESGWEKVELSRSAPGIIDWN